MPIWNKAPFVRILLPFIVGILVANFFFNTIIPYSFLIVLFFIAIIFVLTHLNIVRLPMYNNYFYGVILFLLIAFSGYYVTILNNDRNISNNVSNSVNHNNEDTYIAKVLCAVEKKENSYKIEVKLHSILSKSLTKTISGNAVLYLEKDSMFPCIKLYDIIVFSSKLDLISTPKNPQEFDYSKYMFYKNIYVQGYVKNDDYKVLKSETEFRFWVFFYDFRNELQRKLKENIGNKDESSIALALLVGDKSDLSKELSSSFANVGAMHILAVSGLHVGIVFLVINSLLGYMQRNKKLRILKLFIILIVLWSYAIITGLSPSVLRASIMFTCIAVSMNIERYSNIYNTLCISAFLLLFINPYYLFNVGFQLSYIAVIGIVYLQPKIYGVFKVKYILLEKMWALTSVSVAAQIATLPISLFYFHQFPNYFIITNLVVIPAAFMIVFIGLSYFCLSAIPFIGDGLVGILSYVIGLLNSFVVEMDSLPYSTFSGISISFTETVLLYIILVSILAFISNKHFKAIGLSLITITVLIGFNVNNSIEKSNQSGVVVYNIPKETAIDFINSDNGFFVTTSTKGVNENKISYHITPNRDYLGIDNLKSFNLSDSFNIENDLGFCFKNNFVQIKNRKYLILDNNIKLPEGRHINVDEVIFCNNHNYKISELLKSVKFNKIIFASSNSWYKLKNWKEECEINNIEYWDVTESGAYVNI